MSWINFEKDVGIELRKIWKNEWIYNVKFKYIKIIIEICFLYFFKILCIKNFFSIYLNYRKFK